MSDQDKYITVTIQPTDWAEAYNVTDMQAAAMLQSFIWRDKQIARLRMQKFIAGFLFGAAIFCIAFAVLR